MKKLLLCLLLVSCSNQKQVKAVEQDLCTARAIYKREAAGKLDPAPGSAREKLEAAEDAFCATLAP